MNQTWKTAVERLPNMMKYLVVLAVIVFISFLFPDHVQFQYQFEQGQTWHYDDLVAPFDFAIKKPESEIAAERARLEETFSPYYELDQQVAATQADSFDAAFNRQLAKVGQDSQFQDVVQRPDAYRRFGRNFLANVYRRGIIRLSQGQQTDSQDVVINILEGGTTREQNVHSLLTEEEARQQLSDTLFSSGLPEPEFLYPVLEQHLVPNITYDDTLTQGFKQDLIAGLTTSRGMVRKGELIIPRDGLITESAYQKLVSLKEQYEEELLASKSRLSVFVGHFLLISMIIGVFLLYLARTAKVVFNRLSNIIFVFLWIVAYGYLVYAVDRLDALSAYLIPFCIVPIVIKTFFNARLALFVHLVVVLIASFLTSLGFEFTFLQLLAGIVVLLSNVDTRDWTQFFYSMLFIFLAYGLGFLGLSLIQEGDIQRTDWSMYTWFFLNVFLTLLAYPLIPLLERFFGFTSSITLMELSDMNRPLLRELAMKAPGTLQHSLQVANLAEAAARRIDADPLLVKVGALYHDIGKTLNPGFFIENQSGKNPHEGLSQLKSAKVIIGHVEEGVKMARKYRLPAVLTDFIRSHHGTTRVEYFYRNYLKEHPDEKVDETLFRYPGPRPASREETILMIADSVEAACKSLKEPTERDIDELIDKIISGKINQGQLEHSAMTFHELETCREVFKQTMKSVYHVRIEYPREERFLRKESSEVDGALDA